MLAVFVPLTVAPPKRGLPVAVPLAQSVAEPLALPEKDPALSSDALSALLEEARPVLLGAS